MRTVARSLVIEAPPERVFAAYLDFASWLEWVPHFHEVTPLDGGPLRPGFRARIRTRFAPGPTLWEVTELRDGRSFAWAYEALPGLRLAVDHIAEADGAGARATLALDVSGPLGLLVAPGAAAMTRVTFDRSLAALKARLESVNG
jgi:uncharacterized protein YndB with AHSA1/START domain